MSTPNAGPAPAGAAAALLRGRLHRTTDRGATIPVAPRERPLPLSFAQSRLWVLDRLRPDGTEYLVPVALRLRGPLVPEAMAAALAGIVRRHEVLRTRYPADDAGEPVQVVDDDAAVPLEFDDLSTGSDRDLDALLATDIRPFDLAAGPVLRARLVRLAAEHHVLLLVAHHIALDGWSAGVLVRELATLYAGHADGGPDADTDLPPLPLQYADFAVWQRAHLSGERLARGLDHWRERLGGVAPLELPTDRPRPVVWDPRGATVPFYVPAALSRRANALGREHGATPFMTYLAAFWVLLSRYSGQDDVAVGSPVAGRTRTELEQLVGFFVNMLVLRADLTGNPTFGELLDRARTTAIDAYAHQDVPFERLVDELAGDRDLARNPLFQVAFIMQDTDPVTFTAGSLTGKEMPLESGTSKFDLSWTLEQRPDGSVAGTATFASAMFDPATLRRMAGHYVRLLDAATTDPDRPVGSLPLLSYAETAELIRGPAAGTPATSTPATSTPATSTPATTCLHDGFAEQAARTPDAVALTADGRHLTYAQLDARANRVARRLRALGVGREDLVGICLSRGPELVPAILGILKVGAAYLPLDPGNPAERLAYILADAGARTVVVEKALLDRLPVGDATTRLLVLDDPAEQERLAASPALVPPVRSHPDDLAYVIYTSGSTGRPMGVQVTHANVVRLFTATAPAYRFGAGDVWTLFHSYAFDFSVWEMWGALLYGGRLVVVPLAVARSPQDLLALLADEGVTVLNQTPSVFRGLVELAARAEPAFDRLSLRAVILGGEALDVASLWPWWRRFGGAPPQVVNMYGITETTVHVTYRSIGPADLAGDKSPIGAPIADLTMYILDDELRPVPVGVPGEIYVGGPGLARGYLGQPALTAWRFVPDPYGPPGARLYRSGDRARVLPDGDVAYLGRFDDQVKIRGFRIELGEVQSCLAAHPDVRTAVVVVDEPAPGDRRLVGYIRPRDGAAVSGAELRAYAAQRLPGHMIPAVFVTVAQFPITANGKVDRGALPRPDDSRPDQSNRYTAPRTPTEDAVAAVWSRVLGVSQVGVHDNFFALGGDSIRAVRLVGALRAAGHGYTVTDLFRHPSVAALTRAGAAALTRDGAAAPAGSERIGTAPFALPGSADRAKLPPGLADAYPMSMAQAGMVYEMLADPRRNLYHNVTSYLIRDDGAFDPLALAAAADAVVARHEVLRTSFDLTSYTEPLQLVHPQASIRFGHDDLRGIAADEQEAILEAFRARERAEPFDVAAPPLVRIHAHRITDDRWYLWLTECHAVLDGWSHNSLVSELLAGYRAIRADLPWRAEPLPAVRYADFIAEERRIAQDVAHRRFWAERLGGAQKLAIPAAWADPDGEAYYEITVPIADLDPKLRALARAAGASVKSVLLAAHVAVWRVVSGQHRFFSGLVCNGRTEVEGGDRVSGMFLNPVPFTVSTAARTWLDLVRDVFAEEVALWPHRRFPLQRMQREFGGGDRLLDVAFNYLDFHVLDRAAVDTAGSTDVSPNEFPLAVSTEPGVLVIAAQSRRIGRRYANLLAAMYRRVLTLMATDPDGGTRCSPLPPTERDRLLAAGRATRTPVPPGAVHELIAGWARRTPQAVAVQAAGGCLTYGELADRAARWASHLRTLGVAGADVVGVGLPRDPELVAAVLGVLTVGAAYVPVAPAHPADRLVTLLQDALARVLITTPEVAARLPAGSPPVVVPADLVPADGLPAGPKRPAGRAAVADHSPHPDEIAYVVYTSGSTGRPKGVMVRHGALADRVWSMRRTPGLGAHDALVAVVPAITDVAQLDLFGPLVAGGRVVLADEDLARDPTSLAALLDGCGATIMQASPTTWRMLVESGWSPPVGFRIVSGGESMGADLVRRLCATDAEVWDMYGPNEATIFCFGSRLRADGTAAEWAIAANTSAHLLDADLEPVPDGVPGQIFVGGAGLARGYLDRPGHTADLFRPDPYAPTSGARMYATGDVGRRGVDGRIEILGRIDHQLKIRGFRVELGEVENTLTAVPGVRAAVVHPVPGPDGTPRLAAYLIVEDGHLALDEVRAVAAGTLPDYLVPAYFRVLESFPALANGKVDRSALPMPGTEWSGGSVHVAPQGPAEETIASVMAEVLGVERVGRHDDFFAIGGHSLLMLRIIIRLREKHGIDLTFRDFLTHRTVPGLAAAAAAAAGGVAASPGGRRPALLWLADSGERDERGGRTPLFCVHPGGGSAHWYRDLAERFAPERPVAAFEWPGLHGDHEAASGVPDIAAMYLAELRAARPAGPYHLLGWCGSSGITWELAQRLRAAGEPVRLMLLDPVVDVSTRDNRNHRAKLAVFRRGEELFRVLLDRSHGGHDSDAVRRELATVLSEVVDDGAPIRPEDIGEAWSHQLRSVRELLEARLAYPFEPFAGGLDLIAGDELVEERHESMEGRSYPEYVERWRRLATGGLRIHRVPGGHLGVLRPPHVGALAAVVAGILTRDDR